MKFFLTFLLGGAIAITGCAWFNQGADTAKTSVDILRCQQVGREGPDGGHIAAYDSCMADAGLRDGGK